MGDDGPAGGDNMLAVAAEPARKSVGNRAGTDCHSGICVACLTGVRQPKEGSRPVAGVAAMPRSEKPTIGREVGRRTATPAASESGPDAAPELGPAGRDAASSSATRAGSKATKSTAPGGAAGDGTKARLRRSVGRSPSGAGLAASSDSIPVLRRGPAAAPIPVIKSPARPVAPLPGRRGKPVPTDLPVPARPPTRSEARQTGPTDAQSPAASRPKPAAPRQPRPSPTAPVRADRVAAARAAIARGDYDNDERMDAAVERMLAEVLPRN